jgi:uncharacterized protein with HEPN domain
MRPDDRELLVDMLDQAEYAARLLASAAGEITDDRDRFSALCYAVQTIGEAASQVSKQGRSSLPDVSWQKVIGMRPRLVHAYRTVVPEVVVSTVRDSIPPLIISLRRALESNAP